MAIFSYLSENPDSAVMFLIVLIIVYFYDNKIVSNRLKSYYKKEEVYSKEELDKHMDKFSNQESVDHLENTMEKGFQDVKERNEKSDEMIIKHIDEIKNQYQLMSNKIDEVRDKLPNKSK